MNAAARFVARCAVSKASGSTLNRRSMRSDVRSIRVEGGRQPSRLPVFLFPHPKRFTLRPLKRSERREIMCCQRSTSQSALLYGRVHQAQAITYLKLTNLDTALLVNFNVPVIKSGLRRLARKQI